MTSLSHKIALSFLRDRFLLHPGRKSVVRLQRQKQQKREREIMCVRAHAFVCVCVHVCCTHLIARDYYRVNNAVSKQKHPNSTIHFETSDKSNLIHFPSVPGQFLIRHYCLFISLIVPISLQKSLKSSTSSGLHNRPTSIPMILIQKTSFFFSLFGV